MTHNSESSETPADYDPVMPAQNVHRPPDDHSQSRPSRHGWARLKVSFLAARAGLTFAFRTQLNMRIHFAMAALVALLAVLAQVSIAEWALLALCVGAVIAAELFNTAIEMLVDFISPNHHEQARDIKDLAAGGVLIAALTASIVGLLILVPKFWAWIP